MSAKTTIDLRQSQEPGTDLFPVILLANGVKLSGWLGDDGAMVFEVATTADIHQRIRVYVNDGDVYDDDPDAPVYSNTPTTDEEN